MARRRAAIYVRISDDKAEDAAGVGRQEQDCRQLAVRLGWDATDVYVENDTSAFKQRRVVLPDGNVGLRVIRPEYRRLIDDMRSGAVTALVAYDLDRVARDPRDLEDLIEVMRLYDVQVRSVTGSLDLSTDAGVAMARVMVAIAAKSSQDTQRRVKRKQQQLAEAGQDGGGGIRPYGYDEDRMTVNRREAAVVREIAERVLAGDSLNKIATDLNRRKVPTVRGGKWVGRSVHSAVTKPRVAGLRQYQGEVIGEAAWPAIIDQDTWERVRIALDGRSSGRSNALQRWLSGLLVCSHCRQGLIGWQGNSGPRYWCATPRGGCGRMAVAAVKAERTVETLLLAYLQRPDVLDELRAATSTNAAERARAEMAEDEAQLKELASLWAAKQITTPEYLTARRDIEERIETSRRIVRAAIPGTVRRLVGDDVEAVWKSYGPAQRREVARIVFPDGVEVLPATSPGVFDPRRLRPL